MKWLVRQEGMLTTLFLQSYHFLPRSLGHFALVSVSHEYIINTIIHRSYIFPITLVLRTIMTLELLELVYVGKWLVTVVPLIISALLDNISAILIYRLIQRLPNWTGRMITLRLRTALSTLSWVELVCGAETLSALPSFLCFPFLQLG